jgi:hypothetical protein
LSVFIAFWKVLGKLGLWQSDTPAPSCTKASLLKQI